MAVPCGVKMKISSRLQTGGSGAAPTEINSIYLLFERGRGGARPSSLNSGPMTQERFKIETSSASARVGKFTTAHGTFETPNFMPVGTRASVRGVDVERLREAGAQIILVNTYHLWLRPGHAHIRSLGGIQKFCGWDGPILSDSGGFQIFSLSSLRTLSEKGVEFRSHLDGAKLFLSPELAVEIQETLGVDIAMVLDECPPATLSHADTRKSLELTLRWAERALNARSASQQTALFAITQGAVFRDLRSHAAAHLAQLPFDGYAIGGLSVGEPKEQMYEVLSYHPAELPDAKVRYLMGVGSPRDIVEAVYRGVDLFDCVMPTRAGRFGRAFVGGEEPFLNIRNARFASDIAPLDPKCGCLACRTHTRAYLHHLFRVDEMLGPQLLSIHNLTHYLDLMGSIRRAIRAGTIRELYDLEAARWKGFALGEDSPEQKLPGHSA